jgi:hypothetical protein
MHRSRVVVGLVAVVGAIAIAPAIAAPSAASLRPAASTAAVGHLLYVTNDNRLLEVSVDASGAATGMQQLAPVTEPTAGHFIQIDELSATGDGKWVAWREASTKKTKFGLLNQRNDAVILRNVNTGKNIIIKGKYGPLEGFAGDTLVSLAKGGVAHLVLTPTPHFVTMHQSESASTLATYAKGIVEDHFIDPHSKQFHDQIRLTDFHGHHQPLHTYVAGNQTTRTPDLGWSSSDGKHVAIELGNHQDFGGIGPSSLLDVISLSGSHHITHLGHYGTAKAWWRVEQTAFAGSSDGVWAAWSATRDDVTVKAVVAQYAGGHWKLAEPDGIAVAANSAGWVVAGPGKYVNEPSVAAPQFITQATGPAVLIHGSSKTQITGVEGTQFAWTA